MVDEPTLYDAVLVGPDRQAPRSTSSRRSLYEPADPDKDLRTLSFACVLVPHIGSNTAEANVRMAERALRNVTLGERGDFAAMDLLNPEVVSGRART